MRRYLKIFFMVAVILFTLQGTSCAVFRPSAGKKAEKMQKKQDKIAAKEYKKAKEEHYKKQAESTQMMMKEAKKQQRKANKMHKRSLWDRIFRRKCPSG